MAKLLGVVDTARVLHWVCLLCCAVSSRATVAPTVPHCVAVRLNPATAHLGAASFHPTTNVCLALLEEGQPRTPMTGEHWTDHRALLSTCCLAA